MESLISLSAAALIVAAALALLVLAVSRLGKSADLGSALQVMGLITLKFAILGLGFRWMSRQSWFVPGAAAWGVAIPLLILVLWKGRSKTTEKKHG